MTTGTRRQLELCTSLSTRFTHHTDADKTSLSHVPSPPTRWSTHTTENVTHTAGKTVWGGGQEAGGSQQHCVVRFGRSGYSVTCRRATYPPQALLDE